jgi:hypothetical protein
MLRDKALHLRTNGAHMVWLVNEGLFHYLNSPAVIARSDSDAAIQNGA